MFTLPRFVVLSEAAKKGFLEIALVAAIPRCESLAQQSGLRAPDNSSECSREVSKKVIPDLEEDQMAVSFEESED